MTPFTEDDLKRLEECLKGNGECNVSCKGECADISALLARLEAAEALIEMYRKKIGCKRELEAWLKAAGK